MWQHHDNLVASESVPSWVGSYPCLSKTQSWLKSCLAKTYTTRTQYLGMDTWGSGTWSKARDADMRVGLDIVGLETRHSGNQTQTGTQTTKKRTTHSSRLSAARRIHAPPWHAGNMEPRHVEHSQWGTPGPAGHWTRHLHSHKR